MDYKHIKIDLNRLNFELYASELVKKQANIGFNCTSIGSEFI